MIFEPGVELHRHLNPILQFPLLMVGQECVHFQLRLGRGSTHPLERACWTYFEMADLDAEWASVFQVSETAALLCIWNRHPNPHSNSYYDCRYVSFFHLHPQTNSWTPLNSSRQQMIEELQLLHFRLLVASSGPSQRTLSSIDT